MEFLALIVTVVGAVVYLITDAINRYVAVGELGRLAFLAGLIAYLFAVR